MKSTFLKWLIILSSIIFGTFILFKYNILNIIYEQDRSYLSVVIFSLFCFMTLWCGIKSWSISNVYLNSIHRVAKFRRLTEIGWFVSEICLSLGMAGTVIGFIFMLSGFNGLNIGNPSGIQNLLSSLGSSMGTALYTTITGLACSLMLKIQYFNLSLELDRLEYNLVRNIDE